MQLFPAIDILDGQAVRLLRGVRENVTHYGKPADMARKWKNGGAEWLHVVDLNGAFDGQMVNSDIIEEIVESTCLRIQIGGGIRTLEAIQRYLDLGVSRVILGTAIFEDPQLLPLALKRFGEERIVCGMDARDGKIAIKGWLQEVDKTPEQLGAEMKEVGVKTIVFTDISRDGALCGVNVRACKKIMDCTGLDVIASGGLKGLEDVRECAYAGLHGAILGKALYEHKFELTEAFEAVRKTC